MARNKHEFTFVVTPCAVRITVEGGGLKQAEEAVENKFYHEYAHGLFEIDTVELEEEKIISNTSSNDLMDGMLSFLGYMLVRILDGKEEEYDAQEVGSPLWHYAEEAIALLNQLSNESDDTIQRFSKLFVHEVIEGNYINVRTTIYDNSLIELFHDVFGEVFDDNLERILNSITTEYVELLNKQAAGHVDSMNKKYDQKEGNHNVNE